MVICLLSGSVMGQATNSIKENIIKKFRDYVKMVPREEVFIHTDRDSYISGEEIWFNVYLADRLTMLPNAESRIVYFEILNPENRPVAQKRIGLINGFGAGQAELSDSLSTGEYTIRGYTSWMKNFLPENCFYKNIRIYNRDKSKTFNKITKLKFTSAIIGKSPGKEIVTESEVTMVTDNSKQGTLEILIKAENGLLTKSGNQFLLFIQTHGVINFAEYEWINPAGTTVSIPRKLLLPGINQITLFSPYGLPVNEAYIYTPALNNEDLITLKSENRFGKRSRIPLDLTLTPSEDTKSIRPNISISVTPLTGEEKQIRIDDYMIFGSEFGLAAHDALSGLKTGDQDQKSSQEVFRNIKSNWIDWDLILTDKKIEFKYPVEKDNSEFRGTLLREDKKPAPSGEFIWLSIPGKTAVFQYATTDSTGNFSFPVHIDEEVKELILQPGNKSKDLTISIETSFSDIYPDRQPFSDSTGIYVPEYISDWSANNQVRKIYEIQSSEGFNVSEFPAFNPLRFYGKPDEEIVLDDYIKLPNMDEIFFEIVKFVSLKKKRTSYEFSMIDPSGLTVFDKPPTSMVDGVILDDPDKIAAMDPELVEKIDVVLKKYVVGDHMFFGIINIITRKGDGSIITLPEKALRIPFRTIDKCRNFLSPDYSLKEVKENRTPDLRNTLYWNPSACENAGKTEIIFWAGDIKSDYLITIQGINSEGRFVSAKKIIRVE
jgi:hypothetical protein